MSGILCFQNRGIKKAIYPQPFGVLSVLGFKTSKFISAHSTDRLKEIADSLRLIDINDPVFQVIKETEARTQSLQSLAYSPPDTLFSWLSNGLSVLVSLPEETTNDYSGAFVYTINLDSEIFEIKVPLTDMKICDTIQIEFDRLRGETSITRSAFEFESWVYEQLEILSKPDKEDSPEPNQETSNKPASLEDVTAQALSSWEHGA